MELMDVVRFQVGLLGLGADSDRDFNRGGVLLGSTQEDSFYLNAFYPLQRDFRYEVALLERLRAHYAGIGRDGYLVRYCPAGTPDHDCAVIHVPADACAGAIEVGGQRFACVETDDAALWCRTYVAGSPWMALERFERSTARLRAAHELRMYLFTVDGLAVGAGGLVAMGRNAWLANGYSVAKQYRGDVLGRARLVRMSTTGDVAALTSFRFARVLARAMPSVSILGRIGYHRLATAVPEAEEVGDGEMA